MAKLTTEERNDLPDSAFAIPEDRAYPIQDKGHAQSAAMGLVAEDNGSPAEKARVHALPVERKFGMASAKAKARRKK